MLVNVLNSWIGMHFPTLSRYQQQQKRLVLIKGFFINNWRKCQVLRRAKYGYVVRCCSTRCSMYLVEWLSLNTLACLDFSPNYHKVLLMHLQCLHVYVSAYPSLSLSVRVRVHVCYCCYCMRFENVGRIRKTTGTTINKSHTCSLWVMFYGNRKVEGSIWAAQFSSVYFFTMLYVAYFSSLHPVTCSSRAVSLFLVLAP